MKQFVALQGQILPVVRAMSEPLALSLGQQFELERMNRAGDDGLSVQRASRELAAVPGFSRRSETSAPT